MSPLSTCARARWSNNELLPLPVFAISRALRRSASGGRQTGTVWPAEVDSPNR